MISNKYFPNCTAEIGLGNRLPFHQRIQLNVRLG
jgi:hypothetical protein